MRRLLMACPLLLLATSVAWGADDTKKAAETRKLLKTKVTFNWKDTPFGDVVTEMKDTVKGLRIHVDNKGGVNNNKPITASYKDKPLEDVLADLLGKYSWGYYVNNKKDAYDGDLFIKVGDERGYAKGDEPKTEDKPKEKPKEKPKVEDKPKEDDKPKTEDDPDKVEKDAARKLKLAKRLLEDGQKEEAIDSLEQIKKKFKGTKAAQEAEELLDKLKKDQ